ncbi:Hypothetical protein, conserved [Brucella abortus str. 2308 A]|nr:Hypothetical protein, conserved [Brucella abortus str. 2308 A]
MTAKSEKVSKDKSRITALPFVYSKRIERRSSSV